MACTAKQQASVGSEAVVVQADFLVTQGHVLRDQRAGHGFRQPLGGHHVTPGRQHFTAQPWLQVVEVGVAAQNQALCPYFAACRMHGHGRAMLDAQHRALLEDAYSQAMGHACFALDQVERVQVA